MMLVACIVIIRHRLSLNFAISMAKDTETIESKRKTERDNVEYEGDREFSALFLDLSHLELVPLIDPFAVIG